MVHGNVLVFRVHIGVRLDNLGNVRAVKTPVNLLTTLVISAPFVEESMI